MKPFEHGGNQPPDILDFSANINPLGLPESVKKILAESTDKFTKYPDPNCTELVKKLSLTEKIPPENIICGNGAADLIYRLVYTVKPTSALLVSPTFSEYEKALREVNCKIKFHCLDEQKQFELTQKILDDLHDIDIAFLCDPNNPTGRLADRDLIADISAHCKAQGILLVIDECFLGFCDAQTAPISENTVILKAFTKIYAMAGLRLGYMLTGDSSLAEKIRNTGQCWNVSVPAQLAGIAALDETKYIEDSVKLIKAERKFLADSLTSSGIKVFPSDSNFLLIKCDMPLGRLLLNEGIAIRNCENYRGLDEHFFRIAVKDHNDNMQLINALKYISSLRQNEIRKDGT